MDIHEFVDLLTPSVRPLGALTSSRSISSAAQTSTKKPKRISNAPTILPFSAENSNLTDFPPPVNAPPPDSSTYQIQNAPSLYGTSGPMYSYCSVWNCVSIHTLLMRLGLLTHLSAGVEMALTW